MNTRRLCLYLLFLTIVCTSCAQTPQTSDALRTPKVPAQYGIDKYTSEQKYNAHYVEAGEGPTAILIPGLFGTYRGFSRMIPFLAPHFRLIALDNFGTGDSERPDESFTYTVAEQADMIVRLMDELKIDRATLIGVSYGGMISLNVAARYPDRVNAVACIEGAVIMPKPSPYISLERGLDTPLIGDLIIGFIHSGLFDNMVVRDVMGQAWPTMETEDQTEVQTIIEHFLQAATRPTWLSLTKALRISGDFTEEAKVIKAPILYLYGEKSSFHEMTATNIAYFKDNLPNVHFVAFEDGVHDLELQKPKETAAKILDFLATEPSHALASTTDSSSTCDKAGEHSTISQN